jgi:hypothetical protein
MSSAWISGRASEGDVATAEFSARLAFHSIPRGG